MQVNSGEVSLVKIEKYLIYYINHLDHVIAYRTSLERVQIVELL